MPFTAGPRQQTQLVMRCRAGRVGCLHGGTMADRRRQRSPDRQHLQLCIPHPTVGPPNPALHPPGFGGPLSLSQAWPEHETPIPQCRSAVSTKAWLAPALLGSL